MIMIIIIYNFSQLSSRSVKNFAMNLTAAQALRQLTRTAVCLAYWGYQGRSLRSDVTAELASQYRFPEI